MRETGNKAEYVIFFDESREFDDFKRNVRPARKMQRGLSGSIRVWCSASSTKRISSYLQNDRFLIGEYFSYLF